MMVLSFQNRGTARTFPAFGAEHEPFFQNGPSLQYLHCLFLLLFPPITGKGDDIKLPGVADVTSWTCFLLTYFMR